MLVQIPICANIRACSYFRSILVSCMLAHACSCALFISLPSPPRLLLHSAESGAPHLMVRTKNICTLIVPAKRPRTHEVVQEDRALEAAAEPPSKKNPEDMTREELLARVKQLEAASPKPRRETKKLTEAERMAAMITKIFHGKRASTYIQVCNYFKKDVVSFFAEHSVENKVCSCLSTPQKTKVFEFIQDSKKPSGYKLPDLNDSHEDPVQWAAYVIMITHCMGVTANKSGITKPRGLMLKTLYEYLQDTVTPHVASPAYENEDLDSITSLDGLLLRVCHGHICNVTDLRSVAEQMEMCIDTLVKVLKNIVRGDEESEDVDESSQVNDTQ